MDFIRLLSFGAQKEVTPPTLQQERVKQPPVLHATEGLRDCIERCELEFNVIVNYCKTKGKKYEDPSYSVTKDPTKMIFNPNKEEHDEFPVHSWKRSSELSTEPKLFIDGVAANDIKQGCAGTCYFLGALAALSAHKEHLESLFVACDLEAGVVAMRFFKNNEWVYVIIDDYLPVDEEGTLICASCKDPNEFWVPLAEKAWAKLHGCYENVGEGSWVWEAVVDMTGGSGTRFELATINHADAVFYLLQSSLQRGCLVSAGLSGAGSEVLQPQGIVSGHAYTILRAQETSYGLKLVQLRNPWGGVEWEGDWSDESGMWTPELLKEFNHVIEEDGTFWMSHEDFVASYSHVEVCRVFNQEWVVASCTGTFQDTSALNTETYSLKLNGTPEAGKIGRCVVVLSQKDRMMAIADGEEYFPTALKFLVFRCPADSYDAQNRLWGNLHKVSPVEFKRSVSIEMDLDPRFIYTIKLSLFDNDGDGKRDGVGKPFSLRVYSNLPIHLEDNCAPDFEPEFEIGTKVATTGLVLSEEGQLEAQVVSGELAGYSHTAPFYYVVFEDGDTADWDAVQMLTAAAVYNAANKPDVAKKLSMFDAVRLANKDKGALAEPEEAAEEVEIAVKC